MSDSTPRRATPDDVAGIQRLVAAAFGVYVDRMGRKPAPMTADYARLVDTERVWVVDGPGEIVAVLVTQARPDHLLLDVVAVAPTAQGAGHGGTLLRRADRDARDQGLSEIRLCTNEAMTENLEFYPRRGFKETGRGVQDGFHRVFFAKAVAPSD
ncbi:GNAT family N-acetyltransferase [Mycobacterium yunnanensis]|uniref:GNAT family N-acetyltransferase n=1 Tax=Mycobacterium yunnanensis TaxID=368477 RepID=A0A9X2Z4I3_9MYCO|nr:GNAT family N-acetyltransferase [Mycobacterium yunnanensis]MCV7422476.1 GNAT family N-acetyltransferase [Mycobacterium yunnanensis]